MALRNRRRSRESQRASAVQRAWRPDGAGNVYFSSTFDNAVFKMDTAGTRTLFAGTSRWGYSGDGGPAISAQFRMPKGLALDGAGNLYIADTLNHAVRKVSPSGIITTVAGTGERGSSGDGGLATAARLWLPSTVAVDGAGNLYIANGGDAIRRVSPAGIITTVVRRSTSFLEAMAADNAGNLYYSDQQGGWVRKVSPSGAETVIWSGGRQPGGLAVDRSGILYIADTGNNRILRQVGPAHFTPMAGTGGPGFSGDGGTATSAHLDRPNAVAVDGAGIIYIADTYNNRIRRVVPGGGMFISGIITTVAGNGAFRYSGDGGPATSAQIDPVGVAAGPGGDLYIADASRIRRVSPAGGYRHYRRHGHPRLLQ